MTKKQNVINAAIELFAEKGLEATSIQQITDKCGISKGAFYLTFKSKEELILAIIDHFMQDITQKIDHSVNTSNIPDEKLYNYFFTSLQYLIDYKSFALIFLREQIASVGGQCFGKMMYYEELSTFTMLKMLDDIYGKQVEHTKYDLVIFMQGILKAYMNLILFSKMEMNIENLAKMMVEKTNILAANSKIIGVTSEYFSLQTYVPYTKNTLVVEIESLFEESLSPIQKQSVELLLNEINSPQPNEAIIYGMTHNLEEHKKGKWVAFLIRNYMQNPIGKGM